jgi:hypothetical protein
MDFGIAETGIAHGSLPGTNTEVQRVGFPFAEIQFVSKIISSTHITNTNYLDEHEFPNDICSQASK